MKMKGNIGLILGIVAVILIAGYFMLSNSNSAGTYSPVTSNGAQGRTFFTLTDDKGNLSAVTSILVTINSIKVHSESQGWVTVSTKEQTYDLIQLNLQNVSVILADVQLKNDTYNQISLDVTKVIVTDANGSHEAKMPSSQLKIKEKFVVGLNSTSSVSFDIKAGESLHVTGNGLYILAPVIGFESREDVEVEKDSEEHIRIHGGDFISRTKIGTDVEGNVGENMKIDENSKLRIDSDMKIRND